MPQVIARHGQRLFRPRSYWVFSASEVSLVGWNGPLTEQHIELFESFAAQGIPASRVTLAEHLEARKSPWLAAAAHEGSRGMSD